MSILIFYKSHVFVIAFQPVKDGNTGFDKTVSNVYCAEFMTKPAVIPHGNTIY